MTNISAYAETVATHYWGQPTTRRGHELRWGTHGSKSLDLKKGTWFDHENNEGGGVIDLVKKMEGAGLASIPDVLERRFGIAKQTQKALQPARYLAKCYDYYNEDGELAYQVQRFEPKTFRQRQPDGKGGWLNHMNGVEAVPYRLPDIMLNPNKTIFIVEGEKCADKLATLGAIATTSHGGAGNWKESVNRYFTGRKVVILPDADAAGDKHAKVVIANLMGVASEIRRVDLPGLTDKQDVYDWFDNGGSVEALRALVRDAEILTTAEAPDPVSEAENAGNDVFPLMSIKDLRNMPPVQWLVEGLLTRHGFSVLYGPPGVGKSFLAIDMALSIAYGQEWHGHAVSEGAVVYIAGEGVAGIGKRLKAWQYKYGKTEEEAPLMLIPMAVQFRDKEDVERLMRTLSAVSEPIRCIVIDTVHRSMVGMEENSSTEIGIFVEACDAVRRHADCAVLAIHHSGKDATRGMRGSNALLGACDTSLVVRKVDQHVVLATEKQKDAEPIEDMGFMLEQVPMLGDSSAVMVPTEAGRPKKRMNKSDQEALDALRKAIIDTGQQRVRMAVWEEFHRLNSLETSKSTRTRARQRLQDSGCIAVDNGFVWIINDLSGEVAHDFG